MIIVSTKISHFLAACSVSKIAKTTKTKPVCEKFEYLKYGGVYAQRFRRGSKFLPWESLVEDSDG